MRKVTSSSERARKSRLASFTLVELMTVMAIILILAALVLGAWSGVMKEGGRKRAQGEIQAMSAALEGYKTDNGVYPIGTTTAGAASQLLGPPSPGTYLPDPAVANAPNYQNASQALYQALSGQTNFNDAPVAGVKSYYLFKINQLGNNNAPAGTIPPGSTYIRDPWNNAYGYSTGDNKIPQVQYPNNGTGFFDLWSTGGTTGVNPTTDPNNWIVNWK